MKIKKSMAVTNIKNNCWCLRSRVDFSFNTHFNYVLIESHRVQFILSLECFECIIKFANMNSKGLQNLRIKSMTNINSDLMHMTALIL